MAIEDPVQVDDFSRDADRLLAAVRDLVLELHPHRRRSLRVGLDDELDRDLGFDSLSRAELLIRLERAYRVNLPNTLLATAERPRDLLLAIANATTAGGPVTAAKLRVPALTPTEAIPSDAATYTDVLDWHVRTHPDRPHLTLWDENGADSAITYRDLYRDAQSVAAGLLNWGLAHGGRVVIMLPTGHDFFHAFLGVLLAGGIPVPIYPPMRMSQLEDHLRRQVGIMRNAEASLLITVPEARSLGALLKAQVESLWAVETIDRLRTTTIEGLPAVTDPRQTALIQYTSGSTGDPKGVVLSHANLLANIRAMGNAMEANSADVFVSWLPLYHDMGLIGAWLGCLYFAAPVVIMSPLSFLVRPEQWLWAIHRHRGTLSASPNFGFELCLKRIEDHHIEGLDLSSLRMVVNGAEPVSPQTIRRFTDRFAPYGFRPGAMAPVYGLAEGAVGLAFPPPGRLPIVDRVERRALASDGRAEPAGSEDSCALEFVACGRPLAGHEVRIVDATGREVAERHEGRLEFRGPSTTAGYYRNEAKTRELFNDDWLDSGDRAYIASGDIFITGRIKDIVIRAGRNIYPHEVEEVVGTIDGVRTGCVALFGSTSRVSGTERLVILAETRETEPRVRDELRHRIERTATDLLGSAPDEVVLAPPRTVPKTSSGKIRRSAARALYERGRIGAPARALWLQITRLVLAGVTPRLRRMQRTVLHVLYAGYWWTVLIVFCAIVWPIVVLLPVRPWRWPVAHYGARMALCMMGTPLTVNGVERLPKVGGILVVNHASYIDGLVLSAALPGELTIVVKSELNPQIVAGKFLRRLGAIFVGRFESERGVEDTQATLSAAQSGQRIVVFPEGTLTRMPGLLEFRLGAFLVAAQAGVPVVPVTLRGTRSVLRARQWFPRRGPVSLEVDEPLWPEGHAFAAAVRLRDAARRVMLARVGEPDLAAVQFTSQP